MLNPFGDEYSAQMLSTLVRRDPSLGCAALLALATFVWGAKRRSSRAVKHLAAAFLIGFAPLSVWIWDIPGAGRPICNAWHDGQLVLPLLGALRTRHFYLLGALITACIACALRAATKAPSTAASRSE